MMAADRPLSDVRVIDFTHVLAGPACAYYLGLLGADVIKVESASRGDAMRYRGGTDAARSEHGMSTAYMTQGAGKRSLAVDLATPDGLEIMTRLLSGSDVLVENHLPRTMAALKLTETDVRSINPRLIHCAMTGYGRGESMENAPAYDVNIQAACGLMTMTGTSHEGPTRTGAPIMDYATALAASFAICAALHQRHVSGEGTFIDVSMLETGFALMSSTITDYIATGNEPKQRGNAANSRSPAAGSFTCKSGLLSLGVNEEHQFRALADVLDCKHWLEDPRFSSRSARVQNVDSLVCELKSRLLTRSAEDWEQAMTLAGVPAARVRTLPEALEMAHVVERQYVQNDPGTGVAIGSLPFRMGNSALAAPTKPCPAHGANTTEILTELGYGPHEIKALAERHIVAAPTDDSMGI